MSGPRRRFLERAAWRGSPGPTVIGIDSVFVGDISGKGPFIVQGQVHGNGTLQGALHLSVTATWHGDIHAQQAVVAGTITGALVVEQELEIGRTAVIRGSVSARTVAIANGAIVEGAISVTSEAPIVKFEEKRAAD